MFYLKKDFWNIPRILLLKKKDIFCMWDTYVISIVFVKSAKIKKLQFLD